MKNLIINADDFGYDEDTTNHTINLFERQVISSATIMTSHPFTDKAIDYAKNNIHRFSFGLHFNIVDGHHPLSKNCTSLTNNINIFEKSNLQRIKALTFRINPEDVAAELHAQLSYLFERGLKVTHVDSHGHMHKFPNVIKSMMPVLKKFHIDRVRCPQNMYQKINISRFIINTYCEYYFKSIKHPSNSFFLSDHADRNWLVDFLNKLPNGITELGIHPGGVEKWRHAETAPFLADSIFDILSFNNIKLISYSEF